METKTHFKMYKDGKQWTTLAATVLAVIGTGTAIAKADEVPSVVTQEVSSGNVASLADSQVTLSATSQATSAASNVAPLTSSAATDTLLTSNSSAPKTQASNNTTTESVASFVSSNYDNNDRSATASVDKAAVSVASTADSTDSVANVAPTSNPNKQVNVTNLGDVDDHVVTQAKSSAANVYHQTSQPQEITRVDATATPASTAADTITKYTDPAYFSSYTWLDPDPTHYTFDQIAINDGGLIVTSTNRNGDGTVYIHELMPKTYTPVETYTLSLGQRVISKKYGFEYANQDYGVSYFNKMNYTTYMARWRADGTYSEADHYTWVPKLVTATTNFVDETGTAIKPAVTSQGLAWQTYTDTPATISGYTLDQTKLPTNQTGQLTLFGKGWTGTMDYDDGVTAKFVQLTDAGDIDVTITDDHQYAKTPTTTQVFHFKAGDESYQSYTALDWRGWEKTIFLNNPTYGKLAVVTYVYSSNYAISARKTVDETINYVDLQGNVVAAQKKATPLNFLTVYDSATKTDAIYYSTTKSAADAKIDPGTGKPVGDGWQTGTASFEEVSNPTVAGYHVISTTAPNSDLNQTSAQSVDNNSQDLIYNVVYAKNPAKPQVVPPVTPPDEPNPVPQPDETPGNTPTPTVPKKNNVTPNTPVVSTPTVEQEPSVPVNETPQQLTTEPKLVPNAQGNVSPVFGPIVTQNINWLVPTQKVQLSHDVTIDAVAATQPQKNRQPQRALKTTLPRTGERDASTATLIGESLLGMIGLSAVVGASRRFKHGKSKN
ncbi:hypothetical protein LROSL1_2157 [Furfurilactobacillus rossiae]|uniref:MucBP domain-containing protein n=1 Tax=Furfurilactobacillus rossiae TaxID=231049 RepID=UPI0015B8B70F|nr:MucBP domain-containing protein [Furfurilactobacillus rossiae]MCF6164669.1 KxYKxGKxW signal peptide domain-containing protein [Furfurilactobacillus rossiae]QLE64958.1 hypothetical protein LROSL1_2157 [Furfurilactobacillus rossiae]